MPAWAGSVAARVVGSGQQGRTGVVEARVELLTVRSEAVGDWQVLRLAGQLDVATAPRLRQALQEAQYGGATHVVLDLAELEFIDSFGLGVLIGGLRRARIHDVHFAVAGATERVRQVLEVTGLDVVFRLVASVEEATSL